MAEMMMPGGGGMRPPGMEQPMGPPPPTGGGIPDPRLQELAAMAMQPQKPRDLEAEQAAMIFSQTFPAMLEMARLNPALGPLVQAFIPAVATQTTSKVVEASGGFGGLLPQTSQTTPF